MVGHRPRHVQVQAIAGSANHREAVGFRPAHDGVIVLFSGTKHSGELFHREELAERRAGRIVEFLQEVI